MTGHLRLAWDATPPSLTTFEGRRVTWRDWQHLRVFICPPPPVEPCECRSTEPPMACGGMVCPRAGERTPRGRSAWPYLRLQAFRCLRCLRTDVYDMGEDGEQWICLTQDEELTLW